MANRYKNISIDISAGMFSSAASIASRYDWRTYLNGIYIKSSVHGGINIIATDGHRMIYFWDKAGSSSCDDIILPKNELMGLIKLSKKSTNKDKIIKVRSSGKIIKASLNKSSFKFNLIDAKYPKVNDAVHNIPTNPNRLHSVLYRAKYILDFKHLFYDNKPMNERYIGIHMGVDGHFFAASNNGFYLTMPYVDDINKHMLDYIFSLAHKDEGDILLKADIKNRGIEGYQFLKDLLGPDKAKILKLPLYGNL